MNGASSQKPDLEDALTHALLRRLVDRLVHLLTEAARLDAVTACHVLLCAYELEIQAPEVSYLLARLERTPMKPAEEAEEVVAAFLRQVALLVFGTAEEDRRDFLDRWLHRQHYHRRRTVTAGWLIGLASEQQHLVIPAWKPRVVNWLLKFDRVKSLRMRAWIPHYLELWARHTEAHDCARQLLSERHSSGAWESSPSVDAAVAYSLAKSRCVTTAALVPSARHLVRSLQRGVATAEVSYALNALKFFAVRGFVPDSLLAYARKSVPGLRSVFLAHSHADKPIARKLATDLQVNGVHVWLDEVEILPGDSIIEKIETGVFSTRYLFLLASRNSLSSSWVQHELQMALVDGLQRGMVRVVPVRLDLTPLPRFLVDKRHVDIQLDYDLGLRELLSLFAHLHHEGTNERAS